MKATSFLIEGIPSILYGCGESADRLFLFVHGKCGYKEEAESFAALCVPHGWQVLSCDLPRHGERKNSQESFDPWFAVPELQQIRRWADARYKAVALRANSIGAWFAMLAFAENPPMLSLFVSPMLDMERLIRNMMRTANVTEAELQSKKEIPIVFGETLSWRYLTYVLAHPVHVWHGPTRILYGTLDNLTERETVDRFAKRFGAEVTIMEGGEHWFHTPSQLAVLDTWTKEAFRR